MRRTHAATPALACAALTLAAGAPGPAAAAAELPVKRITLYRSGVGHFVHEGSVRGDETVTLRFDADAVNDILKSMSISDAGGGRIESVGYASKEPLERRLASFGINIADSPSMAQLLQRLRGVEVRLTTREGQVSGTILAVEQRTAPVAGAADDADAVAQPFVNLITPSGIRSIAVGQVHTFELTDPELASELARALEAVAQARADRTAAVEIRFAGQGERRVGVAYVHEAPVWKTTYRLDLPAETGGGVSMRGWAIVENTTDQDWADVSLALVSGNPVSFTMDLHTPLFLQRPEHPVPVMGPVISRVYEDAVGKARELARQSANESAPSARMERSLDMQGQVMSAPAAEMYMDDFNADGSAGGAAGVTVGEQFRYQIDAPVSIARQRSAMLPIVNAPVDCQRISIYNPGDQRMHPMRGVELVNTTGYDLAPGPVSVSDAGAYAGDAQIGFTSRGQTRLLAYAVDLDVRVLTDASQDQRVATIRISDGLLEEQVKHRRTTTYRLINRDTTRGRTVVIEQPRNAGWDVVSPARPRSESERLWRFDAELEPAGEASLAVVEERVEWRRMAVASLSIDRLLAYATNGPVSKAVADAVRTAAAKQSTINGLESRIAALDGEKRAIEQDQQRLRDNVARGVVRTDSDLYRRYVQKLTDQETRLENMVEERASLSDQLEAARQDLGRYLRDLNVD